MSLSFYYYYFVVLAPASHLPSLPPMSSPLPVSVDVRLRIWLHRRRSFCPSHSLAPCIYLLSFQACACGSDGGVFGNTRSMDRRIFVSPSHIMLRFKTVNLCQNHYKLCVSLISTRGVLSRITPTYDAQFKRIAELNSIRKKNIMRGLKTNN